MFACCGGISVVGAVLRPALGDVAGLEGKLGNRDKLRVEMIVLRLESCGILLNPVKSVYVEFGVVWRRLVGAKAALVALDRRLSSSSSTPSSTRQPPPACTRFHPQPSLPLLLIVSSPLPAVSDFPQANWSRTPAASSQILSSPPPPRSSTALSNLSNLSVCTSKPKPPDNLLQHRAKFVREDHTSRQIRSAQVSRQLGLPQRLCLPRLGCFYSGTTAEIDLLHSTNSGSQVRLL